MKKKVIIVRDGLSKDNGGAITALLSLVMNIQDEFVVKFVFVYEDTIDKNALKDYEYECILPSFDIPRIERKIRLYTTTLWRLNSILKREKPDCVISFGSTSLTLVTILKRIRKYKLICSERNDPNFCNRTISDKIRYHCYNYADKMVFQIPGARDFFNKNIQRKSVIIPNPVGIPVKQWDINGTTGIVCVARMEMRQKRQDVLLNAFKLVLEKYPSTSLHLYGDGADMGKTKELAIHLNICENVIFHGVASGIKDIIIHNRLFVLTSDYEGIPNSLLEAMSLGMPVVATDCSPGGAAFLIDNEKNGLLVSRGDCEAVANAIVRLLSDANLSLKLGQAAREKACRFSYERNKQEWINVINSVII